MNLYNIKIGSTIKINKVSELGLTPVNIAARLLMMQRKKLKIYIKEYKTKIDLVNYRDVLKLCTRLLIDEEFRPGEKGFEVEEKQISTPITKERKSSFGRSKLDPFAEEIIKDINNGVSFISIQSRYMVSHNCLFYWRNTRTYTDDNGFIKLKEV